MPAGYDNLVAVILAGGLGTRIRGVLGDVPKPMAPVNGRPFVEWVVRYLACHGVSRVVLSTGYHAEVLASHFASQPVEDVHVTCVAEPSPMGTAGGFVNVTRHIAHLPKSWLIVNGDSLALASLTPLLSALEHPDCEAGILGVRMEEASRYGTIREDEQGYLSAFVEKRPGSGVINAGVYAFSEAVVRTFPDRVPLSFELEVFPDLIQRGARIKVCVEEAPFLDIGTPDSLRLADGFIDRHHHCFRN